MVYGRRMIRTINIWVVDMANELFNGWAGGHKTVHGEFVGAI